MQMLSGKAHFEIGYLIFMKYRSNTRSATEKFTVGALENVYSRVFSEIRYLRYTLTRCDNTQRIGIRPPYCTWTYRIRGVQKCGKYMSSVLMSSFTRGTAPVVYATRLEGPLQKSELDLSLIHI
eukprot:5831291-Pyramimonas_sp.AAC.1